MNLRVVAHALQRYRAVNSVWVPLDVNINVDVEATGFGGKHTDDDLITLVMPNGEKWQITMERIA